MQERIHDKFVSSLAAAVAKLTIGNGMEAGVGQGPLINSRAVDKVCELV